MTVRWRWDKHVAQLMIRAGLLPFFERLGSRRTNVLRILAYHRVGFPQADDDKLLPTLLSATPEQFAHQMRFLVENYRIISVDDLLSSLNSGRALPARSVMVTFDDGYRDFLDNAWPVLQDFGIPAILFVATDYLAQGEGLLWWDELFRALWRTDLEELRLPAIRTWSLKTSEQRSATYADVKERLQKMEHGRAMAVVETIVEALNVPPASEGTMLNWQEVHSLSEWGLCVGAHTRSHPTLSRVSLEEAQQEILGSQHDLQRELGRTWPVFAYPFGRSTDLRPELNTILREAGFRAAMTSIQGHNWLGRTNPLRLKRASLAHHLSMAEFRLALTGLYDVYGSLLRLRAARA